MNGAGRFSRFCSLSGILSYTIGLWVLEKKLFSCKEGRRKGGAKPGGAETGGRGVWRREKMIEIKVYIQIYFQIGKRSSSRVELHESKRMRNH